MELCDLNFIKIIENIIGVIFIFFLLMFKKYVKIFILLVVE